MQIQYDDYIMLFRIGNDETNVFMIVLLFVCLFALMIAIYIYINIAAIPSIRDVCFKIILN